MKFAAQLFKMKLFAGILLFVSMFSTNASCNKTDRKTEEINLAREDYMDVSYGSDQAQKVDVYLPPGRSTLNTKIILFIHGGSWSGGDKSEFTSAIAAIKPMLGDYAIFNMNYRLATSNGNKFPTQLNDIKSAIEFITGKGLAYGVNTEKIVLIGASAGAQLALLQAYKNNADKRIKAVIDLFGPTDMVSLFNNHPFITASQPTLIKYLGVKPESDAALYAEASPINYVNAQSVPTQIFHGASDIVVPLVQSTTLKSKLETSNVKVEMVVYPTEGHGWFGNNLLDTYTKVIAFIKQNVQ
jgi:acetyl esterase/lipase